MEKIKLHMSIVIILFATISGWSQTWVTGMTFDYQNNAPTWDSTSSHGVQLSFPTQRYDDIFYVNLRDIQSTSFTGGFKNQFVFNRNIIRADLGIGLNFYQFSFNLTKQVGTAELNTGTDNHIVSDSAIWSNYSNQNAPIKIKGTYPSLRLNIGYERELFKFKNIVCLANIGVLTQRRFSFFQNFDTDINGDSDPVWVNFNGLLQQKKLIVANYAGISLRYNSNIIGLRVGNTYGMINHHNSSLNFREVYTGLTYTKIFRESHLGKEQVLYDEYQHLSQTRASEYRRGDKYSFIQFGLGQQNRVEYSLDTPSQKFIIQNEDSILITTSGYYVQPNLGFELLLNTFFTHRWLTGLGFGLYQETYYSKGNLSNQSGQSLNFGDEVLTSNPNNEYQEYWNKAKVAVTMNTAVYFSKRIMKIDPYIKGTASMVMDYDVPDFLKQNADWRTTSFFPIYKIGLGTDIRLRLKSSKFFVLGIGVDYNLNPHINYVQYSVRIGYYRKKKLKNQTY